MYLGLFRLTHRQVPGEQGTRAHLADTPGPKPGRHARPYGASPGPGGTVGRAADNTAWSGRGCRLLMHAGEPALRNCRIRPRPVRRRP